ncbi:MAG: SDR family oxidoreductase [Proteobacteria bacterium]|nr:SDR family oxidoreductase [Pseudomonadota bacterium]
MGEYFDLGGKTALIVGGTSGIGLAVARRFTAAGCRTTVAGRSAKPGCDTGSLEFHACDLTVDASVASLFANVVERCGPLDILVINAGIAPEDSGPLGSMTPDEFDRAMATNTRGAWLCLNEAPEAMAAGGSIILTGSAAADLVFPGYANYGASKSALMIMARHAAAQLGEHGIRVNCISPGTVLTPMQPGDDPEAQICRVQTCLGRAGTTDEVVGAYHFLAADDSRYVTATELVVDGGWVGGVTLQSAEAMLNGLGGNSIEGEGRGRH